MKFLVAVIMLFSIKAFSQDVNILMKEGQNAERTLKDNEAFEKYKQVVALDATNLQALAKCSELAVAMGARLEDKKVKKVYYDNAKEYADKALAANPNSADANYLEALAASRLIETETENKKVVEDLKEMKTYADKALAINPNHAKANYILGKWNFNMVTMNWAKKAAVKVLFAGVPNGSIEDAEKYMEKAKALEPYFVVDFLDLAKAYKFDNKPSKAIEVLNQLVKLPNRTADDASLKAEGKKILSEMQ